MTGREYKQGVATLGFDGGPRVVFRLNPSAVDWNFQINTSVTETVGGRVVQVLGATLSDLTVRGSFGEQRGRTHNSSHALAEKFLADMKAIAAYQSSGATVHKPMHQAAIFSFPPKNWRFRVFIKGLAGGDSDGITHTVGKASYDYAITMVIQDDLSDTSKIIGQSNGVLNMKKDKAIQNYITRIADGIGWQASDAYNGHGIEAVVEGRDPNTPAPRTGKNSSGNTKLDQVNTRLDRIGGNL